MAVLAEGVKQAGSLDGPKVADALRQVSFSSLIGPIAYDDKGDLKQQTIYIFQVRDGGFAQIQPQP
jgi:branched-chain amino acid transport system substrate-binding protein